MAKEQVVNLKNLRALKATFAELPYKLRDKVVQFGTRKGAMVIVNKAKRLVPVGKGHTKKVWKRKRGDKHATFAGTKHIHLRDTIKATKLRSRDGRFSTLYVVHAGKGRNTAHLVEFGTRAHLIPGAQLINGRWVRGVRHPGSRPRPFMRPAFDGAMTAVVAAMKDQWRKKAKLLVRKAQR